MNITDDIYAPRPASERSHVWATRIYAVILLATVALTIFVGAPQ